MHKLKNWMKDDQKRAILWTGISGVSLILSFFGWTPKSLPFDIAWVAIIISGLPIIKQAAIGLFTEFDIRADVLVSIALIASVAIGEIFAAGEVAFILTIGSILENLTSSKAREGIEKLVRLTPRTARIVQDNQEMIVSAESVQTGALLRVLPGETIAVDGIIISGETSIDQSIMTGESLPVDKGPGDEVFSGTVNQFGAFDMQATRVGEDSSLQRMIRLVAAADANKAKVVRLTDRWATWIVAIALTAALVTWLVTGEAIRAVTILVVFCPCALVLATPTAIMAGIGNAARHGVLIRSGDVLERLVKIKRIAFDKTGTLTCGKPGVVAVESIIPGFSENQLLKMAATVEHRSEHPLGHAVLSHAKTFGLGLAEPEDFFMIPGRGVKARVDGQTILAGNAELLTEEGITITDELLSLAAKYRNEGCTIIFVGIQHESAGLIALADTLRSNARSTIEDIHATGVKTLLLTGDHIQAASHIANAVGITDIRSELLPEDKVSAIQVRQCANEPICMIGDGINDAPALKTAMVGVAMGGIGSDIAVDAADIALVSDDISRIPYLLRLSHQTIRTIHVNIILSMGLNFSAIILASLGFMGPVVGALVHNLGSVGVVLNSALLLKTKDDIHLKKTA